VARLVPAHVLEQVAHVGIVDPLADVGVEHAARELGRERTHQEVDELLAQRLVDLLERVDEGAVLLEVAAVVVGLQLGDQGVPFRAHRLDVDLIHLGEIGGVEARRQHRVGLGGGGGVVSARLDEIAVLRLAVLHLGVAHSFLLELNENSESSINSANAVIRVQSRVSGPACLIRAVRSRRRRWPNGT
jgi:hypothetical protein